jgi:Ser/Thr protein kinase RdoA (MazF antagonist)
MPHPREKFSPQELAIVLSHYDLGIVSDAQEFPRGAHASAKMVVTTDRGKYLVKRRPKGKDDPFRVAFAHALQNHLASKNFPLPHLIGTKEHNNSMLKLDEAVYEVFEFVEGGPYDGGVEATTDAGRTLALYHKLLHEYHPEWEPPRGHYHDSKTVREALPRIGEVLADTESARGEREELARVIGQLRAAYEAAAQAVNQLGMPTWEAQIVHSDWHPGNMIFDKGQVVAVIDYDAARVRPRVMDIANGCLQFSMVTGGRNLATWEARTDVSRARAFLRGYDELNVISQAELKAAPFLMVEALIAQAVPPILKTRTFAGLDGFQFLKVMLGKIAWLREHHAQLDLEKT